MDGRISTGLKNLAKNLAAFCFGLLLTIILLEILLRFFPVTELYFTDFVNETNHIIRFSPKNYTLTHSLGWNFYQVSRKRINNDGFFNANDYSKNPDKEVVAVIGDSFVQAMQVDDNETFFYILQEKLKNFYFYSFASYGSQLPTYLVYAEYASENYRPSKMIFVIYLYYNLKLLDFLLRIGMKKSPSQGLSSEYRVELSKRAVDYFFNLLPKYINLEHKDVIFVVDADRECIYNATDIDVCRKSFLGILYEYFINKAKDNGYQVLDLLPIFYEHYRQNKERFEFPTDIHWNELAHYLIANELMKIIESY